jgi:acetyl esterase
MQPAEFLNFLLRPTTMPPNLAPMNLILRFATLSLFTVSPPLFAAPSAGTPDATAKKSPAVQLPAPTEKRVYKEIDGRKLEIWIWKPSGWSATDKRSAIVFYHGGGWRGGSPNAFARQSARLAAQGMVAFSVQYRLTAQSGVTVTECVQDARSAFRWVRAHAAELGIHPDQIAAGGGSAGGHLAAALITLDAINDPADDATLSTAPAALVLFNPALRLNSPRAREASGARSPEQLAALSPYEHVKCGHPPTIIFHGEADTTVPIQSARDYMVKVKKLGGDCTLVGFESQPHGFFNREPWVWDTLRQAEAFLKKQQLLH